MEYCSHFKLMADYNIRMNQQFFDAAKNVPEDELRADKGAYFGSILGTLNHILVGDLIWLSRFSKHSMRYKSLRELQRLPQPQSLSQILCQSLDSLASVRKQVDNSIKNWICNEVVESDFEKSLVYRNTKGIESERDFGELVSHLFNHQTHHRGQVSTLLFQAGIDVGVTDYLVDIPDKMA